MFLWNQHQLFREDWIKLNDVFVFFIKILRNISSNIVNLDIVGVLLSEFDRVAKEPPSCHQIFIHILLNDAWWAEVCNMTFSQRIPAHFKAVTKNRKREKKIEIFHVK